MSKSDSRPIGLFDSGIGGLTVLKTLLDRFPNETFLYLGDTARLPYGTKGPDTIRRYLEQNVAYLKKQNVKAVVVACNSASTVLLDSSGIQDQGVKLYNVIEPGSRAAIRASHTRKIGILGTRATVAAKSYVRALKTLDASVEVFQAAGPLLVPLVEEGWEDDPLTNLVVYRYLQPLIATGIDTLILGCTHYPVLRKSIAKVAGLSVSLVDSSDAIADQLAADFASGALAASDQPGTVAVRLLLTDVTSGAREIGSRILAPRAMPESEAIDIL